jgi:F-type H+-transporting ATPase subunit gamma
MPEQAKVIRKRIRSVSSTKKITRTMEMVATAKLKAAQQRVTSSGPYLEELRGILSEIGASGIDVSRWPHFAQRPVKRTLLFVLTANRGLCGAFNANLLRLARRTYDEKVAQGSGVVLHVAGKKGLNAFRFQGIPVAQGYHAELKDKPEPKDAELFLERLTSPFLAGEVDEVLIVYPHWMGLGRQPPTVLRLLPIAPEVERRGASIPPLFDPSAEAILDALLPLYLRQTLYAVLAEAVAAEQVARRMAMKLATDNASELVTSLTRQYNKARQAQITKELAEILGGTEALKKKS